MTIDFPKNVSHVVDYENVTGVVFLTRIAGSVEDDAAVVGLDGVVKFVTLGGCG